MQNAESKRAERAYAIFNLYVSLFVADVQERIPQNAQVVSFLGLLWRAFWMNRPNCALTINFATYWLSDKVGKTDAAMARLHNAAPGTYPQWSAYPFHQPTVLET